METWNLPLLAIAAYAAFLILYSLTKSLNLTLSDYLYNSHATPLKSTIASVVAGNIGAGTIYGIYSFGTTKPYFSLAIGLAYATGLLIAGLLATRIRAVSSGLEDQSLIGFISDRHAVPERYRWIAWLSIGSVFILQLSVQIAAVGDLLSSLMGMPVLYGVIMATLTISAYIVAGGYKSATVSDHLQSPLIIGVLTLVAIGIISRFSDATAIFHKSSIDSVSIVGSFLFLSPAVFLSIDNWHRIVAAKSDNAARYGFVWASLICAVAYAVVSVSAAIGGIGSTASIGLSQLVPSSLSWVVPLALAVAIFSVVDTTVPPLVAGLPGSRKNILVARFYTAVIFLVVALLAISFKNIAQGVVAAFSSLAVFLPIAIGAIYFKPTGPIPMLVGLPISISAAIVLTFVFSEYALPLSMICSTLIYVLLSLVTRSGQNKKCLTK